MCGWRLYKQHKSDLVKIGSTNNEYFYSENTNLIRRKFTDLFINGYAHGPIGKLFKKSILIDNAITFPNIRRSEDIFFNIDYMENVNKMSIIEDRLYNIRIINAYEKIKHKNDTAHLKALDAHFNTIIAIQDRMSRFMIKWNIDKVQLFRVNGGIYDLIINHLTHVIYSSKGDIVKKC